MEKYNATGVFLFCLKYHLYCIKCVVLYIHTILLIFLKGANNIRCQCTLFSLNKHVLKKIFLFIFYLFVSFFFYSLSFHHLYLAFFLSFSLHSCVRCSLSLPSSQLFLSIPLSFPFSYPFFPFTPHTFSLQSSIIPFCLLFSLLLKPSIISLSLPPFFSFSFSPTLSLSSSSLNYFLYHFTLPTFYCHFYICCSFYLSFSPSYPLLFLLLFLLSFPHSLPFLFPGLYETPLSFVFLSFSLFISPSLHLTFLFFLLFTTFL